MKEIISGVYASLQYIHITVGRKNHYNNKVDVYHFSIVLWELLTNRMPFEVVSNLQEAYETVFKVSKVFHLYSEGDKC